MKLGEVQDEFNNWSPEVTEVVVESPDGWRYDFHIEEDPEDPNRVILVPLTDTRSE